jgi:uncharacterized coiled-coil DUF342 family protein
LRRSSPSCAVRSSGHGRQEQLAAERDRINAALSELRAREASLDAEREALAKAVSELAELRDVLTGGRKQQLQYLEDCRSGRRRCAARSPRGRLRSESLPNRQKS